MEDRPTKLGKASLCTLGDRSKSFCMSHDFVPKVKQLWHPEWQLQNLTTPECIMIFPEINNTEINMFPSNGPATTLPPGNPQFATFCRLKGNRLEPTSHQREDFTVTFDIQGEGDIWATVITNG